MVLDANDWPARSPEGGFARTDRLEGRWKVVLDAKIGLDNSLVGLDDTFVGQDAVL